MPTSGDKHSGDCVFPLPPPPPQKYQRQKDQIIKDYMAQTCQPQKTKMWDSEPSAGKSSEKLVKSREMFQIF